jgi:hypothetical protein
MIKALVDQPQAYDLHVQKGSQYRVRIKLRANTVAYPEKGSIAVKKSVASPFERKVLRQLMNAEPVLLKPTPKVWFLGSALPVEKATQDNILTQDEPGIRCEDHVRRSGMWPYQLNRRLMRKDLVEPAPLIGRKRSAGAGYVAFHPWIDDVVDLIKLRGTHEEAVENIHTDGRIP